MEDPTPEMLPFLIDARRLWAGESAPSAPLLVVDLGAAREWAEPLVLPPCPVLGLGAVSHPLAARLDGVVEPPFGLETIVRRVCANPLAAAATVHLLRALPSLSPEDGLAVESMAYGLLQGSAEHRAWLAGRERGAASEGRVRLARRGGRLALTLDRPGSGNAIDRPMRDALHDGLMLAALDPDIRRVSLRGAGRSFSLGADLDEFGTTTDPATAHDIRARTLPARAALACADKLEVHVQGACVGAGLELAAYAGRITAAPGAWFQLPELAMGILPGAGGCVSLTRRIGRQRTALLILSGKRITTRQALGWGLVDAIADEPPGDECGADV